MRYIFALIFPPLAVLLCGRPIQLLFNCIFTICGYVPGIIHALIVVADYKAESRNKKLIKALRGEDK